MFASKTEIEAALEAYGDLIRQAKEQKTLILDIRDDSLITPYSFMRAIETGLGESPADRHFFCLENEKPMVQPTTIIEPISKVNSEMIVAEVVPKIEDEIISSEENTPIEPESNAMSDFQVIHTYNAKTFSGHSYKNAPSVRVSITNRYLYFNVPLLNLMGIDIDKQQFSFEIQQVLRKDQKEPEMIFSVVPESKTAYVARCQKGKRQTQGFAFWHQEITKILQNFFKIEGKSFSLMAIKLEPNIYLLKPMAA